MISNDCVNTQSVFGENATPIQLIETARLLMDGIQWDFASSTLINRDIEAENFYDFLGDGYAQPWEASSAWLNPPGTTVTGGDRQSRRDYWTIQRQLQTANSAEILTIKAELSHIRKVAGMKVVKAADWAGKLHQAWQNGLVKQAVYLCYRGGSVGSLGLMLRCPICITSSDAHSKIINGSGRLSFETLDANNNRSPGVSNTQSSVIVYLPPSRNYQQAALEFKSLFNRRFGVVKI